MSDRAELVRELRRAARGIDHSLADEPDYERFDAALAAIEAHAVASARVPAPVDGLAPHPGENHEFRTVCHRCGESGYLNVAVITDLETVRIEDRAALKGVK